MNLGLHLLLKRKKFSLKSRQNHLQKIKLRKEHKMNDKTLRKLQLTELDMLVKIDKICRDNNINYFLIVFTRLPGHNLPKYICNYHLPFLLCKMFYSLHHFGKLYPH